MPIKGHNFELKNVFGYKENMRDCREGMRVVERGSEDGKSVNKDGYVRENVSETWINKKMLTESKRAKKLRAKVLT